MTENAPRREICVWHRIPPDGERPGRTRTASVTEASPAEDRATGRARSSDLAALGHASAVPPAVSPAPSITETTTATSPG